jgi:Asp-tRNA(Asn)/Glu-tRNA(Gln) amidotransferase C subunit
MDEQASPLTEDVVAAICQLVRLEMPPERIGDVTPQFAGFFAAFDALDALDLLEVEPASVFSAEWR